MSKPQVFAGDLIWICGEMRPQVYPCDLSPCGLELGIGSEVAVLWTLEHALPVSPLFKHEAKVFKDFKFELGLKVYFLR